MDKQTNSWETQEKAWEVVNYIKTLNLETFGGLNDAHDKVIEVISQEREKWVEEANKLNNLILDEKLLFNPEAIKWKKGFHEGVNAVINLLQNK